MKYIFLDESGDLDFSCASGNYFVIASLCTDKPKPIYNCITRIKRKTSKKYYKSHELHFSDAEHKLRRRVIECIIKNDIDISYLVFDKKAFMENPVQELVYNPGFLKDFLFLILISNTFNELKIKGNPKIIIDRYLSLNRIDKFNNFFTHLIKNHSEIKKDITTEHVGSHENKGIQAVDFIVGSIHQNYTYNNNSLYRLLNPKIQFRWVIKEMSSY